MPSIRNYDVARSGCHIGVDFAEVMMEELLKASKDKPWLEELLIGSALRQTL